MALSALRWFKAALVLQALLVAYCLAMQVLDLFPWNDIAALSEVDDLLQLWTWWYPWIVGATAEWQAEHQAYFSRTLKLIPVDAVHIAPDAQHLLLQLLTLVTVIATAMAVARMEHL
jgi:hypothetical protein